MKASSPASPSPQPRSTSAGPASVSSSAMTPTATLSRIAKFSADGMYFSTTELTGRMARAIAGSRMSVLMDQA